MLQAKGSFESPHFYEAKIYKERNSDTMQCRGADTLAVNRAAFQDATQFTGKVFSELMMKLVQESSPFFSLEVSHRRLEGSLG